MELSKAFDMINHSLFLVRLKAYCFFDQVLCLQDVSYVTMPTIILDINHEVKI